MTVRFPPRRRTLAGTLWGLWGWLQRKWIALEDRLGLFSYQDWIRTVERQHLRQVQRQAAGLPVLKHSFDFVITSCDVSAAAVQQTLRSLRQIKAGWQLLVPQPDGGSPAELAALQALSAQEPGLKWTAHSTATDNEGWLNLLPDLSSNWVVPLRAGDQLATSWWDAFMVYQTIFPQSQLFYWDEDLLQSGGRRNQPFFKPGWSPELLYACNYLESAAFDRETLLLALAQLAAKPAGWWLKAAGLAREPRHIPMVLQHRAVQPAAQRERLYSSQKAGVTADLQRRGLQEVTVQPVERTNWQQVAWKIQPALVSIVIPTKNNPNYLKRCLGTLIEKTTGVDYEVILMDDHSTDPEVLDYYQEVQARFPNVRIYANDGPFNYSQVNNQGARHARGDLLLFLNNDVEIVEPGWLEEMVRWVQLPGVGMVGAQLLYPDGAIQHAGVVLGMTGHAGHIYAGQRLGTANLFLSPNCCRNVSAVTGACMLVRRDVFEQLGGFDEELVLVFNDIELGLRFASHGWRSVYTPAAKLIHYEGKSRSRYMPPRDLRLGAQKLGEVIRQGDPYYSPNLSLSVNWPTFRRSFDMDAFDRLQQIVRYKGDREISIEPEASEKIKARKT